jgi:hypothetical protein
MNSRFIMSSCSVLFLTARRRKRSRKTALRIPQLALLSSVTGSKRFVEVELLKSRGGGEGDEVAIEGRFGKGGEDEGEVDGGKDRHDVLLVVLDEAMDRYVIDGYRVLDGARAPQVLDQGLPLRLHDVQLGLCDLLLELLHRFGSLLLRVLETTGCAIPGE